MTAGIIKFFMLAKSTEIHWNSGSERGISPKREKIVSTLHPNCENPKDSRVPINIAPICPGKRLRQDLGQYTITSIETTPNMRVGAFVVGRLSQTAAILGIKSSGTFSIESPRKSLSCVDIIRTAMPFVNG